MIKLRPLQTGQVYVAVRVAKDWETYPLPPELVARSTILAIFTPANISDYVLVFYNSSQNTGMLPVTDIHIFDWEQRRQGTNGLTPAYAA